MLLLTGQARFADWMELALYNGILSGVSLGGTEYFYQNPLADRGGHRRQAWFECACCPPNLARLLMGLGGYAYGRSAEGLWVHLYAAGRVRATMADGGTFAWRCDTDYPWDGEIRLVVEATPEGPASLFLRIPGWSDGASIRINGRTHDA